MAKLSLLIAVGCLLGANALKYNAEFAAVIKQANIDAQSLDRHYGTCDTCDDNRRSNGYAKRGVVLDSVTGQGVPVVEARFVDQYATNCPKKSGRVCNNQGICLGGADQAKRCSCFDGFFGVACHLKHCPAVIQKTTPGRRAELNNRVVFHAGAGSDGGQSSPSDFIECSGHGACHHEDNVNFGHAAGVCECVHPFYGEDCSKHYCPVNEGLICNNQGTCDTHGHGTGHRSWDGAKAFEGLKGACTCNWPYFGEACQLVHCPSARRDVLVDNRRAPWFHGVDYVECSSHGVCHHETGHAAEEKQRELGYSWLVNAQAGPSFSASARQQGSWGTCECAEPWYGPDCSSKRCPATREGVCNNQGTCVNAIAEPHSPQHNFNVGLCECTFPWFGTSCERKHCPNAELVAFGNLPAPALNYLECSGHGKCHLDVSDPLAGVGNYNAGECECQDGWGSSDCSQKQCPSHRGKQCNGVGTCVSASDAWALPGSCVCEPGYHNGPKGACELKMCPGSSPRVSGRNPASRNLFASDFQVCSGHGRCLHSTDQADAVTVGAAQRAYSQGIAASDRGFSVGEQTVQDGHCDCDAGWFGSDCAKASCPVFNGTECNGQGTCDRTSTNPADGDGGRCVCKEPFFGPDCSWRHCPGYQSKFEPGNAPSRPVLHHADFYECHAGTKLARGVCNYDVAECYCNDQFYGTQCEFIRCPKANGLDCNGQGTCNTNTGQCQCQAGSEGSACEHKKCPVANTHICSAHGNCDQSTGACVCDTFYYGKDCGQGNGDVIDLE